MMVHLGLADGMVRAPSTRRPTRSGRRWSSSRPRRASGGVERLPDVPRRPGPRLRRLRRHPRPDRRAARRHRDLLGADGRAVRHRPARRDAVLLHRHRGRAPTSTRSVRQPSSCAARPRPASSWGRSSTTPPSTPSSGAPRCPTPTSPAGRRCSSSPTSTPATTPTRPCSAARTPSRSDRCSRVCASRSTTSHVAPSSTTSSTPSRSPPSRRRACPPPATKEPRMSDAPSRPARPT